MAEFFAASRQYIAEHEHGEEVKGLGQSQRNMQNSLTNQSKPFFQVSEPFEVHLLVDAPDVVVNNSRKPRSRHYWRRPLSHSLHLVGLVSLCSAVSFARYWLSRSHRCWSLSPYRLFSGTFHSYMYRITASCSLLDPRACSTLTSTWHTEPLSCGL